MLARQPTRRFGELPGWVKAHLGTATEAQLEVWPDAVLDGCGMEKAFAEP